MEWYVIIEGKRHGPMSKASVERLIELGVVKGSTPVRNGDMKNWLQIGHIRDFEPESAVAETGDIDVPRPRLKPQVNEQHALWQRFLRLLRLR
jgi:hypothetical protein